MKPSTFISNVTRGSVRPLKRHYGRTKLKLLYTLVLILCMSAFASSRNECTYPLRDSSPCGKSNAAKTVKELSREIPGRNISTSDDEPSARPQEFSTFQFVKFLYI